MVHALSDTDLIRKLLAMKIKATTAIADNMSLMGLATKAISVVQKMMKKSSTCSNCTKCHTPSREHCLVKDLTCHTCQKTVTGSISAGGLTKHLGPKIPRRNLSSSYNLNINLEGEEGQMK